MSIVTWSLTNQTADSGPDFLVVMNQNFNVSSQLSPDITQLLVHTKPGNSYIITIVAYNVDGRAESQRAAITLAPDGM